MSSMEAPYNATLIDREDLTEFLSIVRVGPDSGSVAEFTPGQFCTLGLPVEAGAADKVVAAGREPGRVRLVRRAYSIASSPAERRWVELLVALIPFGRFTEKLWTVEKGGRLFLDEKIKGHFTLDAAAAGGDVVMVATGTGLAPYLSMLRAYRGSGRWWRRCALVHGVRYAADLAYRAELERMCKEDSTIVYLPTVTREEGALVWTGLRGRVQAVLEADRFLELVGWQLDPAGCHVLLCGNPEMIKESVKILELRGFAAGGKEGVGNIHFERYW